MHCDQVRAEQAQAGEPLERPHAVLGDGALDLARGLVQVHVHRQVELGGELSHLAEGRVGHGIGRMRRQAEGCERMLAPAVAQR